MEYDLCRAYHMKSSVGIDGSIGTEGLHHCLLIRFCVERMLKNNIAAVHNSRKVTVFITAGSAEIPFIVCSYRAKGFPVILRMDKDLRIQSFTKVEHRF